MPALVTMQMTRELAVSGCSVSVDVGYTKTVWRNVCQNLLFALSACQHVELFQKKICLLCFAKSDSCLKSWCMPNVDKYKRSTESVKSTPEADN